MSSQINSGPVWEQSGREKRESVQKMFAEIAPIYDRLNSLLSLTMHAKWRKIAAEGLNLSQGAVAVDVCCGTGDFLPELRNRVGSGGTVLGVDFCLPMLEGARIKQPDAVHLGDAGALPVQTGVAHGVTVGWGLRNVPDIDIAHSELFRVLVPRGRFVSIDMAKPRNKVIRESSRIVFLKLCPILGKLFGCPMAYTYLPESTERFYSREQLTASMERAGFIDIKTRDFMLGNICIHWGSKP